MDLDLNNVKTLNIFEESWKELLKDYWTNRLQNIYCSEGDVRLHLSHKLLQKLHFPAVAHNELPIPIEIGDFQWDLFLLGRPKRKMRKGECIVADIVVRYIDNIVPLIIAEMKYYPFQLNLIRIMEAVEGRLSQKTKENVKRALKKDISRLKRWEKYGPTRSNLGYFLKNIDKIVQIVKSFEQQNEVIYAYLCVINEIFPDLEQRLEKELEKYNPPNQFRLRVQYYPLRRWMEKQLKRLS